MPNEFIERWAYDSAGRLEYYGQAEPGSSESSLKWMIEKYTYTGADEVAKNYPSGSNANTFAWSSKATYAYS
jgi:hypothetical protein